MSSVGVDVFWCVRCPVGCVPHVGDEPVNTQVLHHLVEEVRFETGMKDTDTVEGRPRVLESWAL